MLLFFGIALVVAGIFLLAVTQIVLWRKIKKFNEEWEDEQNEMS
jgi:cytochrome b subunit of formate dehydrogenase